MNARFVAGLAVAAIPIMSLLGATSASADNNTVGKYNDPQASFGNGRSVVRAADMAAYKHESLFAKPPHPRELAAIGQSWDNSFCHDADKRVSERCDDRHR
jgi:hypothetical protein